MKGEAMMRWERRALLLAGAVTLLCGALACRSLVPIYEVRDAPLLAKPGVTLEEASEEIRLAAGQLGWVTEKESPGVLRATLHLRSHVAVVRIEHDTRVFSILPVETQGIRREGNRIHPNYNGWIQNLSTRISREHVRHAAASATGGAP